jgi:TorA maturation chaperone TorD
MVLEEFHSELAQAYRLLALLYLEGPTEDLLNEMTEYLEIDITEGLSDIKEDFTRLLWGPQAPLQPYESLYVFDEKEGPVLWGKTAQAVSMAYASAGLALQEEMNFPPDHIAIEFIFVSYLIENQMVDELIEFFENHIMKWVPSFCEQLQKEASTGFFKDIAKVTKEIIEADYSEMV